MRFPLSLLTSKYCSVHCDAECYQDLPDLLLCDYAVAIGDSSGAPVEMIAISFLTEWTMLLFRHCTDHK